MKKLRARKKTFKNKRMRRTSYKFKEEERTKLHLEEWISKGLKSLKDP